MAFVSSLSLTSGLGRYAALFRAPSVPQVVFAGLLGRLPLGMVSIGTVLLVRSAGHSYAVVGGVVAALSVATAAAAPFVGRLVDRVGQSRVLLPLAFLFPISLGLLVVFANRHASPLVLVVLAVATGATLPPIGACIRSLWPSMLPAHGLRETAYALEAWLQELAFIIGPVLVGAIAAVASATAAMVVAGALGFVGTLWFALHAARAGRERASGHRHAIAARSARISGRAHGDPRLRRARLRVRRRRGIAARLRRAARDALAGRVRARLLRLRIADRRHLGRDAPGASPPRAAVRRDAREPRHPAGASPLRDPRSP